MPETIISADSHVTEPPNVFIDRIDPKYRDRAPFVVKDDNMGEVYEIPGMKVPIFMGLIAAAGQDPSEMSIMKGRFEDLHPGGWDPNARLAEQDRDGIHAEVIYPTVGMQICNHRDVDYKKACMDAYNLWMAEYCAVHPDRLLGIGQTPLRSPEEGVQDLFKLKELGFKGVMLPGSPTYADYDSPEYDDFWRACIELELPPSFHVLTTRDTSPVRGPRINGFVRIIRANQDIMGVLIFSGVFDRVPELKVVCVEADAGWAPHYAYRMDHAYKRHGEWMSVKKLEKMPSDYFREHIYMTFQDDWIAFQMAEKLNVNRLMWANDFPHSDSTWPWSQELLAEHTKDLSEHAIDRILHDNVAELYNITV